MQKRIRMQVFTDTRLPNLVGPALYQGEVPASLLHATRPSDAAIVVEELAAGDLARIEPDLRWLEARASEANPFYGADFLLAASRHFRRTARPLCLAAWRPQSGHGGQRLVGLWPLAEVHKLRMGETIGGWTHPFVVLSQPLVDRSECDAVVQAFIDRMLSGKDAALKLSQIAADGPIMVAIQRAVAKAGSRITMLARYERAVFATAKSIPAQLETAGKELRRQSRRLAEQGQLSFGVVDGYADLKAGIEDFLALEASGWKGRAGTSLLNHAETANFARAMLWSAARRGRLKVARLELDGKMIAGGLVLCAGTTGFLWKIAFDETHARFSPGVQMIHKLSNWAVETQAFTMIDSCAHAGHRMIEAVWTGRRELCDLMIDLAPLSPVRFRMAVFGEAARRRVIGSLKGLRQRVRVFARAA
ncbi:MAG TPA: GNAT family N-acetyltransferase [Beijerinckiaceae bacterium]|nr:GNAT family N-acetyltransferase [Beijerinckiaceae bacterium]